MAIQLFFGGGGMESLKTVIVESVAQEGFAQALTYITVSGN